jgi:hypothetical protein
MAIKGKRRTRATRRGIAAAPRPHIVIPRKPFFRRRSVQITLALVLLAGITALVLVGMAGRRENRRLATESKDASSFGTFVEEVLRQRAVGQPFLTEYLILPNLGAAVGQLKAGQGNEKQLTELAEQAQAWSSAATEAAGDIADLRPNLAELREARNLMRRSLEIYAGMADSLAIATQLEGKPRRDLIASLERQLTAAAQVWDIGWGKLTTVKARLGILESAPLPAPGQPGGIPGVP